MKDILILVVTRGERQGPRAETRLISDGYAIQFMPIFQLLLRCKPGYILYGQDQPETGPGYNAHHQYTEGIIPTDKCASHPTISRELLVNMQGYLLAETGSHIVETSSSVEMASLDLCKHGVSMLELR